MRHKISKSSRSENTDNTYQNINLKVAQEAETDPGKRTKPLEPIKDIQQKVNKIIASNYVPNLDKSRAELSYFKHLKYETINDEA